MTIGKVRSWLYFFTKILGDVNAVKRGRVRQRIQNRLVGRTTARILGKLWR